MSQKRILIVLEKGTLKGISATTDTGSPVPWPADDLAALVPEINAAALARIAELEAELEDARKAPAAPAPATDPRLAAMDAAYARLPEEAQYQLAPAWSTVLDLAERGRLGIARGYVASLPVPEALEPVREEILQSLSE